MVDLETRIRTTPAQALRYTEHYAGLIDWLYDWHNGVFRFTHDEYQELSAPAVGGMRALKRYLYEKSKHNPKL